MSKEYHIVSGEIAQNVLIESGVVDFSSSDKELIVLKDNLGEGKLYDLRTLAGIDERVKWFEGFYNETDSYYCRKKHAHENYQRFIKIAQEDSVYLWLGNDGNEYVWKAAVLNFLEDIQPFVFVLDWSDIVAHNDFGDRISLYSLNVCTKKNVQISVTFFRSIALEERQDFAFLWSKLLENNTDIRALNEDNIIEEASKHYYDAILISECNQEFQSSARVVGMVLGNLYNGKNWCGIGDGFLIERLKQLCYEGKLEMRNQEHGMRNGNIFEVRRLH
jgi:hypothetical protein